MTDEYGSNGPSRSSRFDDLLRGSEGDPALRSIFDGVPGVTLPPSAAPARAADTSAFDELFGDVVDAPAPARSAVHEPVETRRTRHEAQLANEYARADQATSVLPTLDQPTTVLPTADSYGFDAADTGLAGGSDYFAEAAPAPVVRRAAPQQAQTRPATGLAARAVEVGPVLREQIPNVDEELITSISAVLTAGASDLHLVAESTPVIRVDGELQSVGGTTVWTRERIHSVVASLLSESQMAIFEKALELDLAYAVGDIARFRVNIFRDQRGLGAALRIIPTQIKTVGQLGLPPELTALADLPRGLVLVCGPTGSGKSTTLAAIIDRANKTRASHIVTVEDPIEFIHQHQRGIINQREIGEDTHSFSDALKHALRQDPDIILVGEMRDLETISTALTAAETGHLVFGTLHTQDAGQTIDRVIDVYPAHQQAQVRTQLAATLRAVVVQTLIRRASGKGRVVATEVMISNPAIQNLIRAGKTHQLRTTLQAGTGIGMHTLDQDLARLVLSGEIDYGQGLEIAQDAAEFDQLVKNRGLTKQSTPGVAEGTRAVAGGGN